MLIFPNHFFQDYWMLNFKDKYIGNCPTSYIVTIFLGNISRWDSNKEFWSQMEFIIHKVQMGIK
jgi:hypothetical protein